ncbi:MAG TPA: matrixin family metalloprotease [Candidatus Binatia bacterium]
MTSRGGRRTVLACLALVLAIVASVATVRDAAGYAFIYVSASNGVPRRWNLDALPDGRVPWHISSAVNSNVRGSRTPVEVIREAFAAWEALDTCAIRFAFQGARNNRERNAFDRVNLVTLGASESLGTGVLAAAFLSSDESGVLTDVDIVFSRSVPYTTSPTPEPDAYDLQSVAAHEIGHLLGLEHTGLARATMAPFSERGEAYQRTPHDDDRIGGSLLYPDAGFPSIAGSLAGRITLAGAPVFLAHVVAADLRGPIVASALSRPDGSYRIDGLPPGVYVVYAEPLDGPVLPSNVGGFRSAFDATPTVGYGTFFH